MYCTQCGTELKDQDRYCSQCGCRLKADAPPTARERLMLDKENKKIAGVCAGFARYFNVDVVLVRVVFLVLAIYPGIGLIGYLIAWIVMPKEQKPAPMITTSLAPAPRT
jgi:phage shock protein C